MEGIYILQVLAPVIMIWIEIYLLFILLQLLDILLSSDLNQIWKI